MADDYESWLETVLPPWAQGEWGSRLRVALGGLLDVLALGSTGGMGEAAKAHFVQTAPNDAIKLHTKDRWIHSFPGEAAATLRGRLVNAWNTIPTLGTTDGLEALGLELLGVPVQLYDVANDGWLAGYQPSNLEDDNADNWSRFWIIVPQPHPWGVPVFGPSLLFSPAATWGLDITQSALALIRTGVATYRPAHMLPVEMWFLQDATTPTALKANHSLGSPVRIPLLVRTWYSRSFPAFGAGYTFGERFDKV